MVLKHLDLDIMRGEFVGIMGPTGAGKSTLCYCTNGLIPLKQRGWIKGDVEVFGRSTRDPGTSMGTLGRRVGLVFQDPETQFIMMTVEDEIALGLENLGLPRAEIRERIQWALHLVGLDGFEPRVPDELSGGQKQRVAIAAIMAMRPEILVLDEPTSDLDPVGKREIFELLEKIRRDFDLTILLVSHETDKIFQFCDRVIVLVDGQIIFEGIPTELAKQPQLARAAGIYIPGVTFQETYAARKPEFQGSQSPGSPEAVFTLEQVTFTYPTGSRALDNVSLEVSRGGFVAVIGANGSGKTTLIKHFMGLLHPQQGVARLLGREVSSYTAKEIASRVGFCFQDPDHQLFKNTIREEIEFGLKNLGLPSDEIEQRYTTMVQLFDLEKFAKHYESTLYVSKGVRQRLALASVLVLEPEILIIDEPTTGQDFLMIEEFMKILEGLRRQGKTIIIVTHDPRVIAHYARTVVVMSGGKVVARVPIAEFLRDRELQAVAAYELPVEIAKDP